MDIHQPVKSPIERDFRLYAHRGSNLRLPENTIAAFRAALADGANALELDIHCTGDGHFVVCHDHDGRRTAGESHKVRDVALSAIKRWRLGNNLGEERSAAPPEETVVPTLGEILDAFPGVPMSVDLKPDDPGLVPPLLELLAAHGADDRVILASFHNRQIFRIRRHGYPGRTALSRLEIALVKSLPTAIAARLVRGDAAQIPRRFGPLRLDGRAFIRRCRSLGLRADYWVVNSLDQAGELVARGATGIMTDVPNRIAPLLTAATRSV